MYSIRRNLSGSISRLRIDSNLYLKISYNELPMSKSKPHLKQANEMEYDVLPYKYKITSYGADFTVDSLVKRFEEGSIEIPEFQRSYVWNTKQASRFIESLLLGLPVPGIFLSREKSTEKLLVIDGQQRLTTLKFFYSGHFNQKNTIFKLQNVQPSFEGKTYATLSPEDKRRLDDSIIHATIIKQDVPSEDDSSIFFIFERLNTGGVLLSAQEIRSAIYHGNFDMLLDRLNSNKDWRDLYGNYAKHLRDQELILRFFALLDGWMKYSKPIKAFLNAYMAKNRNITRTKQDKLSKTFSDTLKIINDNLGNRAFRIKTQPTAALIDAIMIGTAQRLKKTKPVNKEKMRRAFDDLMRDTEFVNAITKSTSDEDKVKLRIKKAIKSFSSV